MPHGFGSCDLASCVPYSGRDQYSFDFICCEQGKGVVGIHFVNGLATALWFPNFWVATAIVLLCELLEWAQYILIAPMLGYTWDDLDLETFAGSYIGDLLIQGGTGLLAGFLLSAILRMPPLVPLDIFKDGRRKPAPLSFILKTALFFVCYILTSILCMWDGDDWNRGAIIATFVRPIILLAYLHFTSGEGNEGETWIWSSPPHQNNMIRRFRDFLIVIIIESVVMIFNWGKIWLFDNQWYQSWLIQGVIIGLLALTVSCIREHRARKNSSSV